MKTLYLVRHAKSSWKYSQLDDFERPLNGRGRKNAPFMGSLLKKKKVKPDLMISSPANRAAMTARMIADQIRYPLEKIQYRECIYESDAHALIRMIKHTDDSADQMMIIGHNPALTELANDISNSPVNNIPTCGVFCLILNISSWAKVHNRCGNPAFFEFPKKHLS